MNCNDNSTIIEEALVDELLQSLCFLHNECCLQDNTQLAVVLETAIESVVAVQDVTEHFSGNTEQSLRKYDFLASFRALSHRDKMLVLHNIQD